MKKKALAICVTVALLTGVFVLVCNVWVIRQTDARISNDVATLQPETYALVLGTGRLRDDGSPNPFFENRLDAAARLYRSHKVKTLLLSGSSYTPQCDEPVEMRQGLLRRGVPADAIMTDGNGLRTYLSMERFRNVFHGRRCIVVSQRFHCQRALYIADRLGLNCQAYAAEDPHDFKSLKVYLREWLAKVKVCMEMAVR